MVDKTHHLRERFYRGLKKEIYQRLTPSYENQKTPYVTLLRRARQVEEELGLTKMVEARGARDDPQMRNVIQTLKEIRANGANRRSTSFLSATECLLELPMHQPLSKG